MDTIKEVFLTVQMTFKKVDELMQLRYQLRKYEDAFPNLVKQCLEEMDMREEAYLKRIQELEDSITPSEPS